MLPDLLRRPGLRVVFCGTAGSTASAAHGHYYSKPSNKFWHLLHGAGYTPALLKDMAQSHDRGLNYGMAPAVVAHIAAHGPRWVALGF